MVIILNKFFAWMQFKFNRLLLRFWHASSSSSRFIRYSLQSAQSNCISICWQSIRFQLENADIYKYWKHKKWAPIYRKHPYLLFFISFNFISWLQERCMVYSVHSIYVWQTYKIYFQLITFLVFLFSIISNFQHTFFCLSVYGMI